MKLGIVITGLGLGGAEQHLLKILPLLNMDVFVISLTNEDFIGKKIEKKGIKVYYLGLRKDMLNMISVVYRFWKIISEERPDVLDSYLIHANLFARLFGRLFGVKKIINSVRGDYYSRNDFTGSRFLKIIEKTTRKIPSLYLTNSESLKEIMVQHGIPKEKISIVPNGVDIEKIKSKSMEKINDYPFDEEDIVMIYVGSLRKVKGVDVLIKSMAKVDNKFKLLLLGDGPERKNLESLSESLGLKERIKFLGRKDNPLPYVKKSDIFVLPSFSEGMSNALLEAVALRKCCIVSDIKQNKEIVKDHCFKVGDVNDLADKIKQYNDFKKEELSKKYYIEEVAKRYNEILVDI